MLDEALHTVYPYYGAYDSDHKHFDPDKPRIKDIIWYNYDWIEDLSDAGKLRPCVFDNVQKTLLCNTIYLGYDGFECPKCGNEMILYHKCHSRFCNSCGVKMQKKLAAKAEVMCLNVKHRHMVFTIPEEYRLIFRKYRDALNLLFIAARNTVCKVVNENLYRKMKRKQRKTGKTRNDKDNTYLFRNYKDRNEFGMIATLHTFGRALNWNPHIHALVAELIYDPKTGKYKMHHHFDFESLRKTWQYEVNELLLQRFGNEFRKIMNSDYQNHDNGFYVYARYDKDDPEETKNGKHKKDVKGCVNYMMRYASRPAMAESRIVSYNKETDEVHWFYDDHKTEKRVDVYETGKDLLKKMFIHIPEDHFKMVRYYGFYSNREQDLLDKLHEQLGEVQHISSSRAERKKKLEKKLNKLKFRTMCLDSYNRDILRCKCGNIMVYVDSYNPLEKITYGRVYRTDCIYEMREMWLHRKRAAEGHTVPS